jgi:hypothetical protein
VDVLGLVLEQHGVDGIGEATPLAEVEADDREPGELVVVGEGAEERCATLDDRPSIRFVAVEPGRPSTLVPSRARSSAG